MRPSLNQVATRAVIFLVEECAMYLCVLQRVIKLSSELGMSKMSEQYSHRCRYNIIILYSQCRLRLC